jgi:hypothetical protein
MNGNVKRMFWVFGGGHRSGGGKGAKEHEKGMERGNGDYLRCFEGQFWGQICREFAFSQQKWLIRREGKIVGIDRKMVPNIILKADKNNNMDEGDGPL